MQLQTALIVGGGIAAVSGLALKSHEAPEAGASRSGVGPADLLLFGGIAAAVLGVSLLAVRTFRGAGAQVIPDVQVGAGELLPHQIRRSDVAAFLADSKVQQTTFHGTSQAAVDSIIANGVDISRSKGSWADGFYTALTPIQGYGKGTVEVATRAVHPFPAGQSLREFERAVEELARQHPPPIMHPLARLRDSQGFLTPTGITDVLTSAGFDSIRRVAPREPTWLIGLDASKIKVVVADAAGTLANAVT